MKEGTWGKLESTVPLIFSLIVGVFVFLINQRWPAQSIWDLVINACFGVDLSAFNFYL